MWERARNNPNRQKLQVFLLDTPNYMNLYTLKQYTVEEVIKQIMSKYSDTSLSKEKPLAFPDNPDAYELRLLEDDSEEYYMPLYEIAALDKEKKIGEFDLDMIAFCQVRNYTPRSISPTIAKGKTLR